jgi:hypothetical protein
MLIVAAGLFFGQRVADENQKAFIVFVAATLAGLFAAWFAIDVQITTTILCCAAIVGLLVSANLTLGLYWCSLILGISGFLLGMDSVQESLSGWAKLTSLFGSGVAISVLLLYSMGLAVYCNKRTWQKTGIRIIGSWIAASSLLVLSLAFSSNSLLDKI